MDSAVHTRIALADLQATAPRGFDKRLIDLLVAIQDGQRPIETASAAPAALQAAFDATPLWRNAQQLEERVKALEMKAAQINAHLQKLDGDMREVIGLLIEVNNRINGLGLMESAA